MHKLVLALALVPVLLGSGCQLMFHEDEPDAGCQPWAGEAALIPAQELRNPYTGECVSYGGGGGGGGGCGPVASGETEPGGGADQWLDDRWPLCWSGCEGLDEASCQRADGCRAIYTTNDEWTDRPPTFTACWGTAQDGPIRGGDCSQIFDAFECSQHDDCSALHIDNGTVDCGQVGGCPVPGKWLACLNEGGIVPPPPPPPGCTGDEQCAPGDHCNAGEICLPNPRCMEDGTCTDECWGYCVPDERPVACWSTEDCQPNEYCDHTQCLPPPGCDPASGEACPPVCYGACEPLGNDLVPACGALDEATCIDRTDGCHDFTPPGGCGDLCAPQYLGVDCHCDGSGCGCSEWRYQSCATR
jgi:hypothetical protein